MEQAPALVHASQRACVDIYLWTSKRIAISVPSSADDM